MWLTDWVKEFFRKADMVLLALILAASLFGVILIYSATRYLGQDGIRYVPIQIISILLGIYELSSADRHIAGTVCSFKIIIVLI